MANPNQSGQQPGQQQQPQKQQSQENPKDRRTKVLGLTPEGRELAEEILEERFCVLGHLFRHLSDAEKQELVRLIEKLLGQKY